MNVSPWHDIPLKAPSGAYHFVCEIPKWYVMPHCWSRRVHHGLMGCHVVCAECRSRKKFEISTKEGANPILQDKDKKTGNLRSYVYSACGLGVIFSWSEI